MTVAFKVGKLPEDMAERLQYLYRLQEKLQLHHNVQGERYRNSEITLEEFRLYQSSWFEPRSMLISNEMINCKTVLRHDTTLICDTDDIEEQ